MTKVKDTSTDGNDLDDSFNLLFDLNGISNLSNINIKTILDIHNFLIQKYKKSHKRDNQIFCRFSKPPNTTSDRLIYKVVSNVLDVLYQKRYRNVVDQAGCKVETNPYLTEYNSILKLRSELFDFLETIVTKHFLTELEKHKKPSWYYKISYVVTELIFKCLSGSPPLQLHLIKLLNIVGNVSNSLQQSSSLNIMLSEIKSLIMLRALQVVQDQERLSAILYYTYFYWTLQIYNFKEMEKWNLRLSKQNWLSGGYFGQNINKNQLYKIEQGIDVKLDAKSVQKTADTEEFDPKNKHEFAYETQNFVKRKSYLKASATLWTHLIDYRCILSELNNRQQHKSRNATDTIINDNDNNENIIIGEEQNNIYDIRNFLQHAEDSLLSKLHSLLVNWWYDMESITEAKIGIPILHLRAFVLCFLEFGVELLSLDYTLEDGGIGLAHAQKLLLIRLSQLTRRMLINSRLSTSVLELHLIVLLEKQKYYENYESKSSDNQSDEPDINNSLNREKLQKRNAIIRDFVNFLEDDKHEFDIINNFYDDKSNSGMKFSLSKIYNTESKFTLELEKINGIMEDTRTMDTCPINTFNLEHDIIYQDDKTHQHLNNVNDKNIIEQDNIEENNYFNNISNNNDDDYDGDDDVSGEELFSDRYSDIRVNNDNGASEQNKKENHITKKYDMLELGRFILQEPNVDVVDPVYLHRALCQIESNDLFSSDNMNNTVYDPKLIKGLNVSPNYRGDYNCFQRARLGCNTKRVLPLPEKRKYIQKNGVSTIYNNLWLQSSFENPVDSISRRGWSDGLNVDNIQLMDISSVAILFAERTDKHGLIWLIKLLLKRYNYYPTGFDEVDLCRLFRFYVEAHQTCEVGWFYFETSLSNLKTHQKIDQIWSTQISKVKWKVLLKKMNETTLNFGYSKNTTHSLCILKISAVIYDLDSYEEWQELLSDWFLFNRQDVMNYIKTEKLNPDKLYKNKELKHRILNSETYKRLTFFWFHCGMHPGKNKLIKKDKSSSQYTLFVEDLILDVFLCILSIMPIT